MTQLRIVVIAAAVLVPALAAGQRPAPGAAPTLPADIARAFFAAVAHERWVEAAMMVDLEPLERRRKLLLEQLRHPFKPRPMTVEDFMRGDPDKPRVVAEYELAQAQRSISQDRVEYTSHEYANVRDSTTMAQMTPLEAGARWLEARDQRYLMRIAFEQSIPSCPGSPAVSWKQFLDSLKPPQVQVIGAVTGVDTAYVVFRGGRILADQDPGPYDDFDEINGPSVLRMYRRQGRWLIMPSERLMNTPVGMGMGCPEEAVKTDSTAGKKPPR